MKVKERSERWRGGAVRAVKSQGGGAVARWRGGAVAQRACEWKEVGRRASMGPTHVACLVGWQGG